jgi:quercetin dioxygenase-like cupin family protein
MTSDDRLREPPAPRFSAPQHQFDLATEVQQLRRESQAGEEGHRQKALYKHGSTTVALFLLGRLTHLPTHRAKGVVIIQVIRGHLQINAETEAHDLRGGQLLVLAPGVTHDVVAYEESEMLLTVNLQTQSAPT